MKLVDVKPVFLHYLLNCFIKKREKKKISISWRYINKYIFPIYSFSPWFPKWRPTCTKKEPQNGFWFVLLKCLHSYEMNQIYRSKTIRAKRVSKRPKCLTEHQIGLFQKPTRLMLWGLSVFCTLWFVHQTAVALMVGRKFLFEPGVLLDCRLWFPSWWLARVASTSFAETGDGRRSPWRWALRLARPWALICGRTMRGFCTLTTCSSLEPTFWWVPPPLLSR